MIKEALRLKLQGEIAPHIAISLNLSRLNIEPPGFLHTIHFFPLLLVILSSYALFNE